MKHDTPTGKNLIPDIPNPTPDYYCTWQTQLYATADGKPAGQRAVIGEKALFADTFPYGWAVRFHKEARRDLFIVPDDSWDVPKPDNAPDYLTREGDCYGSLVLDKGKFPSYATDTATPCEALSALSAKVRSLGWKGLGGWVCAQESPSLLAGKTQEEYWRERLEWSEKGGLVYWKVDWGKHGGQADFRRMLSRLQREIAPSVTVENAKTVCVIPDSDTFRSYDVPAILSIPMTLRRLGDFMKVADAPHGDFMGLMNCEDEAYLAAAGGFAMGIMRHPYAGNLPDGRADMSFPAVHRNLKTKMREVVRAVRFHRIAPAFGVCREETLLSAETLTDRWTLEKPEEEFEAWWFTNGAFAGAKYERGQVLTASAPAAISRRIALPSVNADDNGDKPFIFCARNPNGVVSVVTMGRTRERDYFFPLCNVTVDGQGATTFGIFGRYRTLTLENVPQGKILAQDLAGTASYDITDCCPRTADGITVPGDLIDQIGTAENGNADTSEPGLMIVVE